jgi:long-chain acyl-CoA synthetase
MRRIFLSGIGEHDKVGVISNNRWEWAAVAAACFSLNANMVPMYEAQLASDWTYILNDSGAKVVFCATEDIYLQVRTQVLRNTPLVRESFCFNSEMGEQQAFSTALSLVAPDSEGLFINAPTPDDLAGLIYTSGTTGKPKGVELSHHNFATNVKAGARSGVDDPHDLIRENDISLAFLPWAHSYGQTCELWAAVSHGAALGIARGIPKILEDLQMVKPTTLFAVPTLYKRIYDGVNNTMETASPLRKNLMKSALAMGRRNVNAKLGVEPPLGPFEKLRYKALDSLVLSKIRDRFGGNMRHGYVAGAACPTEVIDFMDNIGIPVCEGYGLTETR